MKLKRKSQNITILAVYLFLTFFLFANSITAEERGVSFGKGPSIEASDLYGIADFKIGMKLGDAKTWLSTKKLKHELITGVEGNPNKSAIFISDLEHPNLKSLKGSDSLHAGAKLKLFFNNDVLYQIVYNVMSSTPLLETHHLSINTYVEKTIKMNIEPTLDGTKGTSKSFVKKESDFMGMKTLELNCQLKNTFVRMSIIETGSPADMVDFQFIIDKR